MLKFVNALLIVSMVLTSHMSAAQEICAASPESLAAAKRAVAEITASSRPGLVQKTQGLYPLDEYLRQMPVFPPRATQTPWGTEVPHMYGQMGQAQTPAVPAAKEPPETRFGWWGYRHAELHADGVIAELVEKSKPTNCCNGVWEGECRVTKYITNGVGPRMVLIDGMVCPINPKTKIVQLNKFLEPDTVVLCANRTTIKNAYSPDRKCPDTFCLGGGKTGG